MIEQSKVYEKIATDLIRRNKEFRNIQDFGVRIAYLVSSKAKKQGRKVVYADCTKVNERYEWCCPYDFMITVYEPNVIGFSEKQLKILMRHELKHVGIGMSGNEPRFYVVPHDIEDFRGILKKYGLNWQGVI